MDTVTLQKLLRQREGATLEFKRQLHKIYASDGEAKKRQRHELIKDILSLVNGNASVAGETGYLIFGASDELNLDDGRDLYDLSHETLPTSSIILGIVNAFCEPPIDDLQCSAVTIENKLLFVITISPSPHLHETTDKLETPTQTYSKHVVFIRHNENIEIASARQRMAILELKRIRFAEMRHPPSEITPIAGMFLGYVLGSMGAQKHSGDTLLDAWIGGGIGGGVGYLFGEMLGRFLDYFDNDLLNGSEDSTLKSWVRRGSLSISSLISMILWVVLNSMVKRFFRSIGR